MPDTEEMKGKVKDFIKKVGDKAKEVRDSEETKDFIDKTKKTAVKVKNKTKDVAIDVGVKASDAAEKLAVRTKKAMHDAKEKNDSQKEGCYDGEIVSESVVVESECDKEKEEESSDTDNNQTDSDN